MAAAALHEGEVFAGRYRIVRELASGGMGAVYEVVHTVTERRCALKVMLAHTVEREQLRKRFMLESRLAAQIGSEYIVDVLDAGVDESTKAPYLVMELLEGEDLGQRLLRIGPLPRGEAAQYLWHVALALDRTHGAGIVHRDLKASNLFLTRREDGSSLVKVLDFGVAKVLTLERTGAEQRTQTVGTPIYMAPEQFRADGRISAATDIYALGMLSYTLLVGVHYWSQEHEKCENPFAFASIAVHGPKQEPSLRAAREGVLLPDAFDAWFARATSRWPQDRFETATEAVVTLARALEVESALVPLPSSVGHTDLATLPAPPMSGTNRAQPATLESPSGRLSLHGPRTATPSAAPALDPESRPRGERELHTEVSLTVTSGGDSPLDASARPAPRNRMAIIASAVAVGTALAAVGIARPWQSPHDSQKTPAAPAQSATVSEPAASAKPKPLPLEDLQKDRPPTIDIEKLPIAPPDPPAAAVEPEHRGQPAPRNPRKPGVPARPERPGASAPQPPSEPTTDPSPSGKAKVDRETLYGRF